jgi:hypothetical protein
VSEYPADDAVPVPGNGAVLFTEMSGGDDVRWWQAAVYYVPVAVAVVLVGLLGPFHGVWRVLAALAAGVLTYLAVFLVIMFLTVTKAMVRGRRMRRDPQGYFEKITGKP